MATNSLDFLMNLRANTSGFDQGINGAKFAVNALVAAMAAVGVGLSIQGLMDTADKYSSLSARIQQATKENGNFEQAMSGVHLVALQTNSNLQATGDLFTRLNTVGKDMGMTQQQALDLTKTVTQAIQIGGGTAQQSEAAITQFIQAMQGGVLRGEEFNSMMENGYGVAEALATGLGVTTGELRKMAENGELGAERVVKALQSQSSQIQATYDKFPTTIGNALQRISTSWEILIGKMDQSNGASATVAQWLVLLADNIAELDVVLQDIGEGFTWVGDRLKKIDPATIETFKAALISAYETVKEFGATVGTVFEAAFDVLNTALSHIFDFNSGVQTAADQTGGFTKLLQALNVVIGFVGDGFNAIGIGVNLLTGAVYDVASAFTYWKSKILFGETKDQALKEYEELSAKAQEYYTKASDGAMAFKSKGIEAIQEIGKTEEQKNVDTLAAAKTTMDQLLAEQQREVDGKKTTEEEKLKAVQAYAEAAIAANNGVMDGVMQADLITQGYIVTMSEAGDVSVKAWSETTEAVKGSVDSITQARKAADALKLDLFEMRKGYSEVFGKGQDQVQLFAKEVEALGFIGEKAGEAVYEAWQKWLSTAKNEVEIEKAKAKLIEFEEQGVFSTKQVEAGMQAIRLVTQKLPADIDPVTAAFERLGIKTKEQLALAAQSALADFNTIQASGQATSESLKQAYERTMQAAAASGNQAVIAATQAKAAALGLEVQIDSSGKASVKSMDDLGESAHRVSRSFGNMENSAVSSIRNIKGETEEATKAAEKWYDAVSKMKTDGPQSGTKAKLAANAEAIEAELLSYGYDAKRAKQLAKDIYEGTRDGISGYKTDLIQGFETGTSVYSNTTMVNRELDKYKQYAPGAKNVSAVVGAAASASSGPTNTIEHKFVFDGKEVTLQGKAGEEEVLNQLISQLKTQGKSS